MRVQLLSWCTSPSIARTGAMLFCCLLTFSCTVQEEESDVTGVRLRVLYPSEAGLDQLEISGSMEGAELFAPVLLPETRKEALDPEGESVVFLLRDELAGQLVTFFVEGMSGGEALYVGQESVRLALGRLVDLAVVLGPAPVCSNGMVEGPGEECDDGNIDPLDGCSETCQVEEGYSCSGEPSVCTFTCGNGVMDGSDFCDDGNRGSGDGCSATCAIEHGFYCSGQPSVCVSSCGDGALASTEACDDGNLDSDDGCDEFCRIEPGYSCDGEPSVCTETCGNGMTDGSDQCDDGNQTEGDGCSKSCKVERGYTCQGTPSTCRTTCGDGIAAGAETCDDGNGDDDDGCSSECSVESGWSCDGEPSVCVTGCGDGVIAGSEGCDDQNTAAGDGCSPICMVEQGWTCSSEPSSCNPVCGDGRVLGSEACDDGNTSDDDGCSALCSVEAGYVCHGEPSICVNDCTGHDECPYICDVENNGCVPVDQILFVDCTSACPGSGTELEPYCRLQDAVDAAMSGQFIYLPAVNCTEAVVIDQVDLSIIAEEGARLRSDLCPTLLIDGVSVLVEGLQVRGTGPLADRLGGGVLIRNNAEARLLRGRFNTSDCVGVQCIDSSCDLRRSLIFRNMLGGVEIIDSDFVLMNNFIYRNGNDYGTWGGVHIDASQASQALFVNNTVTSNLVEDIQGRIGGVECTSDATLVNCILWQNRRLEVSSGCAVTYSDISQGAFDGVSGNINLDPVFLNPQGSDYHIDPTSSPCLNSADPAGVPPAPDVDYDGQIRPMNGAVDMGADEAG